MRLRDAMRLFVWRRRHLSLLSLVIASSIFFTATILTHRSINYQSLSSYSSADVDFPTAVTTQLGEEEESLAADDAIRTNSLNSSRSSETNGKKCATVEQMGEIFGPGSWEQESFGVRYLIERHFEINGAARVRELHPDQFCRHGFVIGKASEAGFGNEMYKILSAAALSVMLNRSLIIGQTRGRYPFGDFITYSNISFTLKEVKHLWRHNGCATKYGKRLIMRIDDFQKPTRTNVLCSNWREWRQPIIWFQNVTDAVAVQFFLKNIHIEMRKAAFDLFGSPENLQFRPNAFGELMRVLISPSKNIEEVVNWALSGGADPDITLHMRMLMNRSVRALQSALFCIRKAIHNLQLVPRPRVVLVSDTPSVVKDITPSLDRFAEVLRFDYEHFEANMSGKLKGLHKSDFRTKDWGPAPRWVAFVDFFLASRAKHAVISGAHRRVGTTYAQLIAALAAAHRLGENSSAPPTFSFLSSFQRNLLAQGLKNQIGWGHVWNRFAGPLSCHGQRNQCALTPLLSPAWWDGLWQSPIPRDIHRLEAYGVRLSGFGTYDVDKLRSFCNKRKNMLLTVPLI